MPAMLQWFGRVPSGCCASLKPISGLIPTSGTIFSITGRRERRRRNIAMTEEMIGKVKQMIIDSLRIEGMTQADIDSDAPLFGAGLGLDSIDALQLVVAMEKEFGVVVPDAATGTTVFQSVRSMAEYIAEHHT